MLRLLTYQLSGVKIVEEGQSLGMHLRSVIFFALSSPIGVAIGKFRGSGSTV